VPPVYRAEITPVGFLRDDQVTSSTREKFTLTSPTSGGGSVGTVRSRTKATELVIT
jgi:hypothetical protein